MANREIEAILKISAKMGNMQALSALQGKMKEIDRQAKAHNRTQAAMAKTMTASAVAARNAIMRYAAPAAIAYGTARAFKSYAEAERQIERIGITADASAAETKAAMGRIYDAAKTLHMPFQEVVAGVDSMAASGKNFQEIFELLPSVGKAAQASGAQFTDMATTADAISGSMKIAANEMEHAFDILAFQGKAGKFELKDMSQYLPSLAPAFAALGYKGTEGLTKLAAALQVVRMETGTSGEAATSFMDVLTKMESETVTNSFKKRFGVDLRKEMKRAKDSGEDLLEAFVRLSRQAVRGDLSKLPQLFTDKQMLIGMRALINNMDTFRSSVASTANAAGTVDRDFRRVSANVQASIDDMSNSWDRFVKSVGQTVAPGIVPVLDGMSGNLDFHRAVETGLASSGVGVDEAAGLTQSQRRHYAWVGGYRTKEQKNQIDAYRQYRDSRVASEQAAAGYIDGQADAEFDSAYRRQVGRQETRNRMERLRRKGRGGRSLSPFGDPGELQDIIDLNYGGINRPRPLGGGFLAGMDLLAGTPNADELQQSAQKVQDAIVQGATQLGQSGTDAGKLIGQALQAIAPAIGQAIAASFKAAAGNMTINVNGGPTSANINRGATMPDAGGAVRGPGG